MSASRVVIITGAAVGLGRAMALGLLEAGHRVVVTGRNAESLATFASEATALGRQERFLTVRGDVSDAGACRRVVDATLERFACVDALINNAGAHMPQAHVAPKFYEVREDHWRAIFRTNVTGAFLMASAVTPHLIARGWGRIVNHQTNHSSMIRASMNPYGASKAALEASTVAWAEDLAGTGVTVNEILPGGASDVPRLTPEFFPDRSKLVAPSVLVAPIRWLISPAFRRSQRLPHHREPLESRRFARTEPARRRRTGRLARCRSRRCSMKDRSRSVLPSFRASEAKSRTRCGHARRRIPRSRTIAAAFFVRDRIAPLDFAPSRYARDDKGDYRVTANRWNPGASPEQACATPPSWPLARCRSPEVRDALRVDDPADDRLDATLGCPAQVHRTPDRSRRPDRPRVGVTSRRRRVGRSPGTCRTWRRLGRKAA